MPIITGKTIDQLNQVTAITASDELVVYDAEAGTGVEPTKKITGQNAAESMKNLGNMVDLSDIAPAYSASATYSVGDYCVYNGAFYKCSTAITTAEPWTAAHWTQTTVQAELALKVNTADVVNNLTSTATDKPLSANMGKTLNDKIEYLPKSSYKHSYDYDFPTSQAGVSGDNYKHTVANSCIAFFEIMFSNTTYSQIGVSVNGKSIRSGNITSGTAILEGYTMIITLPLNAGDTVSVSFYSNYTVARARLRVMA